MAAPNFLAKQIEFSIADRDLIIALAERLTGSSHSTQPKIESCLVNIKRRMAVTNSLDLQGYLAKIESSLEEFGHFISAVTIHTTSWFREMPHYDRLRHIAGEVALEFQDSDRREPMRILSAGCSTGEEAYSMALVLEEVRKKHPRFEYTIEGWDVDPVCIARANHAVFNLTAQTEIPASFQRELLIGSGPTNGLFTLAKDIRSRCSFIRQSIVNITPKPNQRYDVIFCRNVLIYFTPVAVQEIIHGLVNLVGLGGYLCLGHSEGVEAARFGLTPLGNTTYKKPKIAVAESMVPVPVKEKDTSTRTNTHTTTKQKLVRPEIILIGASTGGTEVLIKLIANMPRPCPPIMVVQHIALSFAQAFAERLAKSAGLRLGTPTQGTILQNDHLYMALGDYHIGTRKRGPAYYLEISRDPMVHSVRPSVDYLFQSVAKSPFPHLANVAAMILTGMGKDGAKGLSDLRQRGAMTFVQDEISSTVFGMPREAIALGAAGFIGNPTAIRQQVLLALSQPAT